MTAVGAASYYLRAATSSIALRRPQRVIHYVAISYDNSRGEAAANRPIPAGRRTVRGWFGLD